MPQDGHAAHLGAETLKGEKREVESVAFHFFFFIFASQS
jgi:hypothetical protein